MAAGAFFALLSVPNHVDVPVRAGAGVQRNKLKASRGLRWGFDFFARSGNSLQQQGATVNAMKRNLDQAP
jgi:hypothetical protein